MQTSTSAKTLSIQVAKSLFLFTSAVYVLACPVTYLCFLQAGIKPDFLLPFEAVLCVGLSAGLFTGAGYSIKKLWSGLKSEKS